MRYCAAYNCNNSDYKIGCENKSFFGFPLKKERVLQYWLLNIRRANFVPSTSSVLCSDHFTEDCFRYQNFTNRRCLKEGAIPTIFSYTKGTPSIELTPEKSQLPREQTIHDLEISYQPSRSSENERMTQIVEKITFKAKDEAATELKEVSSLIVKNEKENKAVDKLFDDDTKRLESATELKKLSSSLIVKNNEIERKTKLTDKLFDLATKRLESAIKRKDFEEMTLAQGMLNGVKKLRYSEAEISKELSSIAKNIEEKSSDILFYFQKQPKD